MTIQRRTGRRAFSLVELMIVVAIIGILAAMATYGMFRYLRAARISEAMQTVGSISRAAHGAFQEEVSPTEMLGEGSSGIQAHHALCDSAIPVPSAPPAGTKYQPLTALGSDFRTGDEATGWMCLRFSMTQPIQYQFLYTRGDSPAAPDNPAKCPTGQPCYEAGAVGDVDGDGLYARVARTGFINPATGELRESTYLHVEHESE